MFKKNKQLITGFILGAIVFGAMPVQAKVQEYLLQKSTAKIMVDGKEFANKDLPVLNYKNSNYIPMATFREICNTIGVGFEWVGESREVRINTGKNTETKPIKETVQPVEEKKGGAMTEIEKDGYELVVVDGVEYVNLRDVYERTPEEYNFHGRADENEIDFIYRKNVDRAGRAEVEKVLITNIPHKIIGHRTHITYDYLENTILPIIKAEGN